MSQEIVTKKQSRNGWWRERIGDQKGEIEEEAVAANADLWRISNERGKGKRK